MFHLQRPGRIRSVFHHLNVGYDVPRRRTFADFSQIDGLFRQVARFDVASLAADRQPGSRQRPRNVPPRTN